MRNPHPTETSELICNTTQSTGFYTIRDPTERYFRTDHTKQSNYHNVSHNRNDMDYKSKHPHSLSPPLHECANNSSYYSSHYHRILSTTWIVIINSSFSILAFCSEIFSSNFFIISSFKLLNNSSKELLVTRGSISFSK